MASKKQGVFPCYENQFQVGKSKEDLHNIADMENFSISIDNEIQEWKPYDAEGWTKRLLTGKSVAITVSGKRNVGDAGNDYIAGLAFVNGTDANGILQWTFPDGTKYIQPSVFSVSNIGAGETVNVGPLEFEALSNGKPEITQATGV